jgi:phosphate transport system substrate-binding protein
MDKFQKNGDVLASIFGILSIILGIFIIIFWGVISTSLGFVVGIVGLIISLSYKKRYKYGADVGFITSIVGMVLCFMMTFACISMSDKTFGIIPGMMEKIKYSGHGFDYMGGFSSTDFHDYTVYCKSSKSKLVTLDHKASLIIENEEDMPVMDGAEACYPLYAAIAKAVYKDIDIIETERVTSKDLKYNGKIVTFSNTIYGFYRLLGDSNYGKIDLFFGAHPSESQMKLAENKGIELKITKIGSEAFVFFVEDDNPVDNLTSDQIRDIYSGKITNWKDVGGKNQGIVAFQRPANSGSQTVMIDFMGDVHLSDPKTYEVEVDAMGRVTREVAQYYGEEGAMGYTFRYFLEELNQEKGIKMLSVDGVYPSIENIENGSYKIVTDLCLITRKNDPNPYVQKMIDYILSDEGQYFVRQTGYAGVTN